MLERNMFFRCTLILFSTLPLSISIPIIPQNSQCSQPNAVDILAVFQANSGLKYTDRKRLYPDRDSIGSANLLSELDNLFSDQYTSDMRADCLLVALLDRLQLRRQIDKVDHTT